MQIIMLLFIGSGLLLSALSIPLILGRIPPNGLYGFRVKKTMEHPGLWYPVNKYSGKWLLGVGLCLVLASILLALIPSITLDIYAFAVLGVWVVIFGIALTASIRYLNSL